MTIRVSGLFASTDAAEAAVRSLADIPVFSRRISRLGGRKLGTDTSILSGTVPGTTATAFVLGNAGQSFGQGVFLPAAIFDHKRTERSDNEEVQLEIWVAPLDAQEASDRLINAHGYSVRLY